MGAAHGRARRQKQTLSVQNFFALLPAAGAEFVGLQSIEYAKNFLGLAAHGEIGDVGEADHSLGIDDLGSALRRTNHGVKNAKLAGQVTLEVG